MKPLCVRVSVRPSANKKKAYSSIIDIIRILSERAYHSLQENKEIFSKKKFHKF